MTNKDRGQFLAVIKMMGAQKEFKGLLVEKINPLNLVRKVDEILDTRKTTYNYQFVKICENYEIENIDNIHNELEELWIESKKEFDPIKVGIKLLFGRLIIGGLQMYIDRISERWEGYIKKTSNYAEELVDRELVENEK